MSEPDIDPRAAALVGCSPDGLKSISVGRLLEMLIARGFDATITTRLTADGEPGRVTVTVDAPRAAGHSEGGA